MKENPKVGDIVIFNGYYSNLENKKGRIISVGNFGTYKIRYTNDNGMPKRVNTRANSFEVIDDTLESADA